MLSKAMEEQQAYMFNGFWRESINPENKKKQIEAPGTYMLGINDVDKGLKAVKVEKKKYLYVSRVRKDYTFYDVLLYIAKKLDIDKTNFFSKIQCYPLYNVAEGLEGINYLSFKICLNESDYEKVCNKNFWPTGILFRPFVDLPRPFCQRWRARPGKHFGSTTGSTNLLNSSLMNSTLRLNEVVPVPAFMAGNYSDPLNYPINDPYN